MADTGKESIANVARDAFCVLLTDHALFLPDTSSTHRSTCIAMPHSTARKFHPIRAFWQFRKWQATYRAFVSRLLVSR